MHRERKAKVLSLRDAIPPLPESDPKAGRKVQPKLRKKRSLTKSVTAGRQESLGTGQC